MIGGDLVVRTLRVSLEVGLPTIFTTDEKRYIDTVKEYIGNKIEYELRPSEMASDHTRVVEEVLRICNARGIDDCDAIGLMLPTSPFRSAKSLKYAIDKHKNEKGIFSASNVGFHFRLPLKMEPSLGTNLSHFWQWGLQ